ncbi:hypothetical protein BOX15_Mlig023874g2 [Macrostomum lignano]|uniref:RING-type E3 ubiquitin transferase n=2 Tax=Macrostomum lignano TaxID=282301 RepID=A0A267EWX5_9PLAT|nr:hypothetical protein BOX15_Mlig023874g2 [Macrostomum lignano]
MMQVPPVPRRNRRNRSRSNANNSNETQQKQQESEQPKAYHFNQCRNIIKSAIKCPICFESMLDPSADSRVLPCQHAFCRSCLAKLLDSCTSSAGDSTRIGGPVCPECRAPISAIRADDLPPNVQLNRLCNELDELQQKHHSSLDSSASKSSGDSANSNCRRRQQRQSCTLTVLSGDFCTATREFNYRSTDSRYLELRPGDLIEIISRRCSTALDAPSDAAASTASAPGWAYGRIGQRKGYFPLACTRPVVGNQRKVSANQSSKKCDAYPVVCALYDYQPSDAISLDCANQSTAVSLLPLVKDRKYLVLAKQPNGWLHGQCQVTMATGLFPANRVSRVQQRNPPPRRLRAAESGLAAASSDSTQSSPIVKPEQPQQQEQNAASANSVTAGRSFLHFLRNFSIFSIFSRSNNGRLRRLQQQQHWSRRSGSEVITGTPTTILSQLQQSSLSTPLPASSVPRDSRQHQHSRWSKRSEDGAVSLYRCIQSRPAATDAELSIAKGELICVFNQRLDGWFRGLSVSTQRSGLFPAACVLPCSLES